MGKKVFWIVIIVAIVGFIGNGVQIEGKDIKDSPLEVVVTDYRYVMYSGTHVEGNDSSNWDVAGYYRITVVIVNMQEFAHELGQINISVYKASFEQELAYWKFITSDLPLVLNPEQYYEFTVSTNRDWEILSLLLVNIDGEWFYSPVVSLKKTLPTEWANISYNIDTEAQKKIEEIKLIMTYIIVVGLPMGGWIIRRRRKKRQRIKIS